MKPDIKGLVKLAKALQRTPKEKFNMYEWWYTTPCGTAGCIAGHAANIFPSRFKKVAETYGDEVSYAVCHRRSNTFGEEAFANGFRISVDDAEELTLSNLSRTRTPKGAAKAVMALVGRLRKQVKK